MTFTDWRTPRALFDPLHAKIGFAVDAAADQDNHLVDRWYGDGGEEPDALSVSIWDSPAFCNPPYGKGLVEWLQKFNEQRIRGARVISLLPAYPETEWWYDYVVKPGADIFFLVGRVAFERACPECAGSGPVTCPLCQGSKIDPKISQPRHPSALVIYEPQSTGQVSWLRWKEPKNADGSTS